MQHYDVLIIGGGIAGSSLAYNLRNLVPGMRIGLLEKNEQRAQHKSYYVRKDLLHHYGATHLIHNELYHQTKETDHGFIDRSSFGDHPMGCVNYAKLCSHLSQDVDLIRDTVIAVDHNRVELQSGDILNAAVVVDATGHKSFLRRKFNLRTPKLGVEVIMYDMRGVTLDGWHTIRLGLGNLTNWGVWIEPIEQETGRAYLGTGNLKYLDQPQDRALLREMMDSYLEVYNHLLENATIERTTFATIAADPVRQVTYQDRTTHYAWIGESAGQVDPYWTIGHGRILDLAEELAHSIADLVRGQSDSLDRYQAYWEEQLFSFYRKNWARARLFYSMDQDEWQQLFQRRTRLKAELDGKAQVDRQSGKKSYGLLHTLKLVGFKNIIRYLNYQRIFTKRLKDRGYWDSWREELRPSLLTSSESEIQR